MRPSPRSQASPGITDVDRHLEGNASNRAATPVVARWMGGRDGDLDEAVRLAEQVVGRMLCERIQWGSGRQVMIP